MKVDISGFTRINGASLNIEFEETQSDKSRLAEDHILDSPISFSGILTNLNGILKLDGQLKTSYKTACYRCLKEIEGLIDIKISESFVNRKQDADELDAYIYESRIVDLEKAMEDNIILNLPMKQLCIKECKGLCQMCGTNLNEASCNCKKDTVNPQMKELEVFEYGESET